MRFLNNFLEMRLKIKTLAWIIEYGFGLLKLVFEIGGEFRDCGFCEVINLVDGLLDDGLLFWENVLLLLNH